MDDKQSNKNNKNYKKILFMSENLKSLGDKAVDWPIHAKYEVNAKDAVEKNALEFAAMVEHNINKCAIPVKESIRKVKNFCKIETTEIAPILARVGWKYASYL